MNCKCHWVESVLAIIIIIFAYMASPSATWVIITAAIILLLHALMCKNCRMCEEPMRSGKMTKRRGR